MCYKTKNSDGEPLDKRVPSDHKPHCCSRWLDWLAVAVFATGAVVAYLYSSDAKRMRWYTVLPRVNRFETEVRQATYIKPMWFLVSVPGAAAIAYAVTAVFYASHLKNLQRGYNKTRWWMYAIALPLMNVTTANLVGLEEILHAVGIIAASLATVVFLHVGEMVARTAEDKNRGEILLNPFPCVMRCGSMCQSRTRGAGNQHARPCCKIHEANPTTWYWFAYGMFVVSFGFILYTYTATASVQSNFVMWLVITQLILESALLLNCYFGFLGWSVWANFFAVDEIHNWIALVFIGAWWGTIFGGIPAGFPDTP